MVILVHDVARTGRPNTTMHEQDTVAVDRSRVNSALAAPSGQVILAHLVAIVESPPRRAWLGNRQSQTSSSGDP